MNLNKVFIIGNLTRDPEMRSLPSGQPVVNFGVATNRVWKDKEGRKQQAVEFHNVVAFGKLAEIIHQYLRKGSLLFVEGRIATRSWDAQDGTKKSRTEIIAEAIQLGPRNVTAPYAGGDGGTGQQQHSPLRRENQQPIPPEEVDTVEYPTEDEVNPEEIPF